MKTIRLIAGTLAILSVAAYSYASASTNRMRDALADAKHIRIYTACELRWLKSDKSRPLYGIYGMCGCAGHRDWLPVRVRKSNVGATTE